MFAALLKKTKLLSDALQSPTLDLSAAAEMIQTIQEEILDEININAWHEIWEKAEDIRQKLDISDEEIKKRISRHPTRLNDSHILASSGHRDNVSDTNSREHHYCVNLYYQVLDKLLAELDSRFSKSNKSLLKAMSALDPRNSNCLDINVLQPIP